MGAQATETHGTYFYIDMPKAGLLIQQEPLLRGKRETLKNNNRKQGQNFFLAASHFILQWNGVNERLGNKTNKSQSGGRGRGTPKETLFAKQKLKLEKGSGHFWG